MENYTTILTIIFLSQKLSWKPSMKGNIHQKDLDSQYMWAKKILQRTAGKDYMEET